MTLIVLLPALVSVFEKSFRPSERAAVSHMWLLLLCPALRQWEVSMQSAASGEDLRWRGAASCRPPLTFSLFWDLGAAKEKRADAEPRRQQQVPVQFCWFCSESISFFLKEGLSQTTVTVLKAPNLLLYRWNGELTLCSNPREVKQNGKTGVFFSSYPTSGRLRALAWAYRWRMCWKMEKQEVCIRLTGTVQPHAILHWITITGLWAMNSGWTHVTRLPSPSFPVIDSNAVTLAF